MLRFVPRIAAVLFLVVAGTLAPAAAGERPFKASGAGGVYYLYGLIANEIEATHLGHSSLVAGVDQDYLELGLFVGGAGSLTSASGDQLYFLFDAGGYVINANGVVGAPLTFTGGTGRFQDATGSAYARFVLDPAFKSFQFQIDGSIDY